MSNSLSDAQKIKQFGRFQFTNDTVYQLLTYGDKAPGDDTPRLPLPNWNIWALGSRGILTWLLTEALNLRRWPWHPDYTQGRTPKQPQRDDVLETLQEYFGSIDQIESAVAELRRIYEHTQRYLKAQGRSTVELYRSFGNGPDIQYASLLASCFKAAGVLERPSISVPTHIMSSWCRGAGYSTYPVTIRVEHPIEDVFCFSELLESKERSDKPALESGEWIIVNRSIDGRLTLPTDALVKNKLGDDWKPIYAAGGGSDDRRVEQFLETALYKLEPYTGFIKPLFEPEPKSRIGLKARLQRAYKVFLEKEA